MEEAITTTRVVCTDSYSDGSSYREGSLETSFFPDGARASPGGRGERAVMNDKDKAIYNSLGSSSSPRGKVRSRMPRQSQELILHCTHYIYLH